MVFRPDGSFNWTMMVAIVGAVTVLSSAVWSFASLDSQAASQQTQINNIQANFNTQMAGIQATLTSQETLIQSESILLSKFGQKLDDLQATLSSAHIP